MYTKPMRLQIKLEVKQKKFPYLISKSNQTYVYAKKNQTICNDPNKI